MQKITPFLWFDNQAEEAANFYVSVFKDGKIKQIARYGDAGPGPKGSVMVVDFEINGQEFTALNGGPTFKLSEAVSFVVHCKTQDEVDYYWEKLSADGGAPNQCGWLKDKYGLSWQITPDVLLELINDPDPAKANRVFSAMLTMGKIDIAKLREAHAS
jgi:predicted 3-demethylubiquinone-9 3-methyltransferase (glyoxalase superfamily)